MRIEPLGGDGYLVWLDTEDYQTLLEHADTDRSRLVCRLCGEAGLVIRNVAELTTDRVEHIEGEWFIQVPNVRTTRGPEFRDVHLVPSLYRELVEYQAENEIADDEPLFDVTKRTLQKYVNTAANRAAEATGDDDFGEISSRDLRRYYVTKLLFDDRLHIRVVMELGGFAQIDSLEHYVPHPKREELFNEIGRVSEVVELEH